MEEFIAQIKALHPANRPPKVSLEQLSIFTRQFAAMLDAGIPLHRALSFFADSNENNDLNRVVIDKLATKVAGGSRLSRAMKGYPEVFSDVYCALVESGEDSGQLTNVLHRLAEILEKQLLMHKKLISAITYPAVLFVASMCSVAFFVLVVLPMIEPMFSGMKMTLPWPTRMLLMSRYLLLPTIIVGVLAIIGSWAGKPWIRAFLARNTEYRATLSRVPLQMPGIGPVLERIAVARYLFSLASMVDSGMTLTNALARCNVVVGNYYLMGQLNKARLEVMEGSLLADAFRKHNALPSAAIHVIGVGEETSGITDMIRYAARMFEEEADMALEAMTAMIEPVIMGGMGIVVGFIIIASMMPTLQLIQNL
jgi:type IV pilus assembly protein PilC